MHMNKLASITSAGRGIARLIENGIFIQLHVPWCIIMHTVLIIRIPINLNFIFQLAFLYTWQCENPTIQNTFTRSNGTLVKMINHLLLLRCMKVTGLHFLHIVMSMHVFNHKCIFCFTKVIYCICIRQSNDWKN